MTFPHLRLKYTAWGYHGGNSEAVLGKALGNYARDSHYPADKSICLTCTTH